ncbi:hypothetical protein GDO78_019547 [Eleutherodactylus coqui]|uniref:Uncharacterized protein n=1 Tax=Eleutherodactylus coqui TaxID=57060 RepID=A0A8J6BKQ7_ELECQ|nr:hypothetical protein GDO78_019547 [Eleutherodactylus coqui]
MSAKVGAATSLVSCKHLFYFCVFVQDLCNVTNIQVGYKKQNCCEQVPYYGCMFTQYFCWLAVRQGWDCYFSRLQET